MMISDLHQIRQLNREIEQKEKLKILFFYNFDDEKTPVEINAVKSIIYFFKF